ncbi:MAG: alpha-amylase [Deltaproteobacteria bacterium]|nr:alpha-amylase [Deltaproteobacteria bacterium]
MERRLILASAALLLGACHASHSSANDGGTDAGLPEVTMSPRIYQLFVRTFGNTNSTNQYDGDINTNGCGKFNDINDAALDSLSKFGVTHIWLTGVIRQATLTDYSTVDPRLAADDPDIVKGRAGSPYAIRDYFDVSPDYASGPTQRMAEFQSLIARIHAHNMKAIIDLVPNHVARSYGSAIKPELDFGASDDKAQFFSPSNNFFYLVDPAGQPLQLSYPQGAPPRAGLDGRFAPEDSSDATRIPRATGNNQTSHTPSATDWYEAIKLNYGFNFVDQSTHYQPTPDTWIKVDAIVAYWQAMGVDGFRCDFAHWVPVDFWKWMIARARARGAVYFFAEAYDSAPQDTVPGYSQSAMLNAGFDALYDYQLYNVVKGIFASTNWANDIDAQVPTDARAGHLLRYTENHDERRVASAITQGDPGNSGFGSPQTGFAVTALLHLLGPDPVMIYNGQEVGEPGAGAEGFGGDDGRTTIFDYWSMPEFRKWVNDHAYDGAQLSDDQKALRTQYSALWALRNEPAIADGLFFSQQTLNKVASEYGEQGHWVYSFVRTDPDRGQTFLVIVNLNPASAYSPKVRLTSESLNRAHLPTDSTALTLSDRLSAFSTQDSASDIVNVGVEIDLPPATARVLELKAAP